MSPITHTMESETMYYSRTTDNKDLLRIAERAALSLGALGGWEVESFGIYVEQTDR